MHPETYCPYCAGRLTEKRLEGRLRLACSRCQRPLYKNPVPATCVVVDDGRRRILLVKRSAAPNIGQWCLPGGFMQIDESPERAALRELKEETGLSGKIETLLGVTAHPSQTVDTVLMIGYLVTHVAGEPNPGDDASQLAWFPLDRLPPIAFQSHLHFIRIYFSAFAD